MHVEYSFPFLLNRPVTVCQIFFFLLYSEKKKGELFGLIRGACERLADLPPSFFLRQDSALLPKWIAENCCKRCLPSLSNASLWLSFPPLLPLFLDIPHHRPQDSPPPLRDHPTGWVGMEPPR